MANVLLQLVEHTLLFPSFNDKSMHRPFEHCAGADPQRTTDCIRDRGRAFLRNYCFAHVRIILVMVLLSNERILWFKPGAVWLHEFELRQVLGIHKSDRLMPGVHDNEVVNIALVKNL